MGSCQDSIEVQEPLCHQAAIGQHLCRGVADNRDSEPLQLLPHLDDNADTVGGGGVEMCRDDNGCCLNSGDLVVEIVSGERGMGFVGMTEDSVGLATLLQAELMSSPEDCEKSLTVMVCECQDAQKDGDNGAVQGVIKKKSDGLAAVEPGADDEIVPSIGSGLPIELIPDNLYPRNGAQVDGPKDAKSGNIQEGKSDSLGATKCDTDKEDLSSPGCKMPPELIPEIRSQNHSQLDDKSGSVQQVMDQKIQGLFAIEADTFEKIVLSGGSKMAQEDNQKDDKSVGDQRIIEEETADGLAAIEPDTCGDIVPSLLYKMHVNLLNDSARNCDQQDNQKDEKSGCVQGVVEKKSNVLAAVEAGINDELLCTSSKKLAGLTPANGFSRSGFKQDKQKDMGTSLERVMGETIDKNDVLVPAEASKLLLSQGLEKSMELMPTSGSPEENAQQDEQKHDKCSVTTDAKVQICSQNLCVEGNSCDMKETLPEISSPTNVRNSVSPQSGLLFGVSKNESSEKGVFDVDNSGKAVECSLEADCERDDVAKIDCAYKSKGGNIISLQGSRRMRKSGWKTLTKRAARKCRDAAKVQDQHGSVEIILKVTRKKRSCFSKPARASIWGSLGNIRQTFKLNNGSGLDEMKNLGSKKAAVCRGRGKGKKTRAGGNSQRSNGKCPASTSCIRLKVKLGNEVCQNSQNFFPEIMDTSASADAVISDYGTESNHGTSFESSNLGSGVEDKVGEESKERHLHHLANNLEQTNSDSSIVDVHLSSKDLEGTVFSEKSAGHATEDGVPTDIEAEAMAVLTKKRYSDPGTSPDSEVINLVPEGEAGAGSLEDSSKAFAAPGCFNSGKKGKKKDRLPNSGNCSMKDGLPCAENINKVSKPTKKRGARQRRVDLFSSSEILTSSTSENISTNSLDAKEFFEEHFPASRGTELGASKDSFKMEITADAKIYCSPDVGLKSSESHFSTHLPSSSKSKECQLPRKADAVSKGRSKVSASGRSRGANGCKERGHGRKSVNKKKAKDNSICNIALCKVEADKNTDDIEQTKTGPHVTTEDAANLDKASGCEREQYSQVDNAWVRCDECHKWRRIPFVLVDSLGQTSCQWICKDNKDEAFADCSIPQEKSNAEINAELGISDAEEDAYDVASNERGLEYGRMTVCKEYEFIRITTNQFLHRNRRSQTIDEIMVCHCKPPQDGMLGCGDECLNRMLNIECVHGTCPCGDLCSNQQFQKRNYAQMKWDRCGKKGFGLRMEDNISKGQFLIEYVGEVLDVHAYEARQKEYAFRGHKHFYFMTLDGSEVIDACAKGNLGRFINHSCDPNCRTEKWMVNGEICIGLFALRDIKKGEEVTFDYNYVRVVGAAAKKCYCGSPQCRGYIGGDPTNTEVIDRVDSDEEFPEPVMLEDGDVEYKIKTTMPTSSYFDGDKIECQTAAAGKLNTSTEIVDFVDQSSSAIPHSHSAFEINALKQDFSSNHRVETSPPTVDVIDQTSSAGLQDISMEETMSKTLDSIQRGETSPTTMLTKASDGIGANRNSKSTTAEEKRVFVKSRFFIKTPHQSGCVKKGKVTTNQVKINKIHMNKSQLPAVKPKKLVESTSNGRFEAVQEKLNELLDAEGGISKRKDSPKGYLKLLLLTAASGASRNGEAIQSNRELSMILDALLKTKSRVVLVDIINKNGLRMLHNIMKQYRRDFKKIPILRKLLKVLEYLAVREILTPEHINGGPPCPGMESFTESILSLTEHDDKQVHQIARNFRDRYIPRHVRKLSYMDREDGRMEFHRSPNSNRSNIYRHDQVVRSTEAIDCVMKSKLATTSMDAAICDGSSVTSTGDGTKIRKRKSRWDQPAKGDTNEVVDDVDKISKEYSYCPHCFHNYGLQDGASITGGRPNTQEDVPPGFSSPNASNIIDIPQQNVSHSEGPVNTVVGLPQNKFISRLPISYGIPMPIVQQCGLPQAESVEGWAIAPGMPFHPFPPLPPFPCHKKEAPAGCVVNPVVINESAEQSLQDSCDPATGANENYPSTACAGQPDMDVPASKDNQAFKRARGSSCDLGRRYFRQQKWNFRQQKWNPKVPPWVRNRNEWGYHGDSSRSGMCSTEVGSLSNEHRNSYCSQDLSCRVEKTGNYFNQHT